MKLIITLISFLFVIEVMAGELTTPFSIGSTTVLPKGIRSLRIGAVTTEIDNKFNDLNFDVGVAETMNQELSYGRLLQAEKDENLKLNVEAQLAAKGVTLNQVAGSSVADLNSRVTVTAPVLAYGITDRWTLALVVPVYYSKIDVATSFIGTEQLQELATSFAEKSRTQTDVIEKKLQDVIGTEVSNKGYKPLESQQKTEIGDISLVSKFLLYKDLNMAWGISNKLSMPTARTRDIDKVVDPAPGDGQWDFDVTSVAEVPISAQLMMIHELGYSIQFADREATRIPITIAERLSTDVDLNASRDLGDKIFSTFGIRYSPWDMLSMSAGYHLGYKQRDQWKGNKTQQSRYDILGHETEQNIQAAILQMSFSTIDLYKRGTFFLPMTAGLGYSQALSGRNVKNSGMWAFDVAMFF
jgi:hypothetical protein